MSTRIALALATAACLTGGAASAQIVRCVGAGGVTYQQTPCTGEAREQAVAIPNEYPAPNLEERNRLFQREADLYKRLEARREREVQEAVLRDAAAERALERERVELAALAAQQQYLVVYPYRQPAYRPRHTTVRSFVIR